MFNRKIKKLRLEYQELNNEYRKVKGEIEQKEQELQKLKVVEKDYLYVESLINDSSLIGIEYNKYNTKLYVCLNSYDNLFNISLRNMHKRHSYPRLYGKITKDIAVPYKKTCEIQDIFAEGENIGNGSIILKYLIDYLKQQEVREIIGWLSDVDIENFDKLEKFYTKNGFAVTFNKERTSGSIILKL